MNAAAWANHPEMVEVVVLFADGERVTGVYDGYGRVLRARAPVDVLADVEEGRAKLVLREFYAGEPFAAVGPSRIDPGQGHYQDDSDGGPLRPASGREGGRGAPRRAR